MRIIAVVFVVFNHTGTRGFYLFSTYPSDSIKFWFMLFEAIFCKFAVPLFFAISGALLLGKKETLGTIWKKRIIKNALILLIISVFYCLLNTVLHGNAFSLKTTLIAIYQNTVRGHLWYMYAYIGYLISLPFLRMIVKKLEANHFYYLIGIVLFINTIPILECLLFGWTSSNYYKNVFPAWLATNVVIYPIVGYYLENKVDDRQIKKILPYLWGINIVCILLSAIATAKLGRLQGSLLESDSQTFMNNYALVNCCTVFLTLKYFGKKIKGKAAAKVLPKIGKAVFGVYLLHIFVMDVFVKIGADRVFDLGITPIVMVWVYVAMIVLVSLGIVLLLEMIPGVKKIL